MLNWYPLSVEERATLGAVVYEAALLDSSVDECIRSLAGIDKDVFGITVGQKTLGQKLDIAKQLGLLKFARATQPTFASLMKHLTDANSDRNIAVHGLWEPEGGHTLETMFGPTTAPVEAILPKRAGKQGRKLKAAVIEKLAVSIRNGRAALWKFVLENWVLPDSSAPNAAERLERYNAYMKQMRPLK
jgi:hypothetical protein